MYYIKDYVLVNHKVGSILNLYKKVRIYTNFYYILYHRVNMQKKKMAAELTTLNLTPYSNNEFDILVCA